MTITYDKEANAAYIYINTPNNNLVSKTVPVSDDVMIDFGSKGELLGIEILNASKHIGTNREDFARIRLLTTQS